MIDLEIKSDGKAVLNKNVGEGELITYQNDYLKRIGKVSEAKALMDLDKDSELQAGYYTEGITVITADVGSEDFLVVKKLV